MAQLRPETRPVVTSMPVEGFAMQTGGSARRRVVPFDETRSSYHVTGVVGHTHNASAVCSILVDNTETSNVPLIINDHFANDTVAVPGSANNPRFTDSAAINESAYDRALERGIGEIAIVPENCHQEIREPARAISEVRTLVTPKDRRDTLTYVEEVGGFVDMETGAARDIAYPDVQVDLFRDYDLPPAVHTDNNPANLDDDVNEADRVAGTGNSTFPSAELRFIGGDPVTNQFTRAAVTDAVPEAERATGEGTALVPIRAAGANLATVDGTPWEGVITMQWDPEEKLYFCPPFEAVFPQLYESNTAGSQVRTDVEVQFPLIKTTVSKDGQCLFASGERPLLDPPTTAEINCQIDQSQLSAAVFKGEISLYVQPFRIATGSSSAIYGPGSGAFGFWDRVRNSTRPTSAVTISVGSQATDADFDNLFVQDGLNKDADDDRLVQDEVVSFYSEEDHVIRPSGQMPTINARNAVAGSAFSMLSTTLSNDYYQFGRVYGVESDGTDYDEDIKAEAYGRFFVPPAVLAAYTNHGAGGGPYAANPGSDAIFQNVNNYPYSGARVSRRLDTDLLESRMEGNKTVLGEIADKATTVAVNGKHPATIEMNVYNDDGVAIPNQSEVVLYQSEQHWRLRLAQLEKIQLAAVTSRDQAQSTLKNHLDNKVQVDRGDLPTNAVNGTAAANAYNVPVGAANRLATFKIRIDQRITAETQNLQGLENGLRTAQDEAQKHRSGVNFVYGASVDDDQRDLFPLESSRLVFELDRQTTALDVPTLMQSHLMFPCTARYSFERSLLGFDFNPAAPETLAQHFWNTRNLGLSPDNRTNYGTHLQQETAPFVTFTQAKGGRELDDTDRARYLQVDADFKKLFDVRNIFQDFPEPGHAADPDAQPNPILEEGAQWINQAGNGLDNQLFNDVRDEKRDIIVQSVGLMDELQQESALGDWEQSCRTKFDNIIMNADFGTTTIFRVAHFASTQLNAQTGVRPIMRALGNEDGTQPLNRNHLTVMQSKRTSTQPVLMTPSYIATHNATNDARQLPVANDMMYIGNAFFSYDTNRTVFVVLNDRGNDPTDANARTSTILMFETDDCEPVVHFDEFYNIANVMTEVRNVRMLVTNPQHAFVPATAQMWTNAFSVASLGRQPDPDGNDARALNGSFCTVIMAPTTFQDMYWYGAPFESVIRDASQTGVVHRSQLRVSQHLCAPLLNPNARIGCTAPLNYDSLHLPPELRDFRIELRDIDFSFLPGNASSVELEALTLYEFNGGNQVPSSDPSLLYMPHFRSFRTTPVGNAFSLDVFSPYGNPSYIALYARNTDRPNEYIKQPLIKTLTIKSGTTMKLSNTILDAREHELFHLTQRNVHPRSEYTRVTNQLRQVILLCAEDIGDMGIAQYQSEKRANFVLSGTLDKPATVTALFIYNNRGLSIRNLEIGVVRV